MKALFRQETEMTRWLAMVVLALGVAQQAAALPCVGDCGADGAVSVDELVQAVELALGAADAACPGLDGNGDDRVTVNELVAAVANAAQGCPSPAGTYTATADLGDGQSARLRILAREDGGATLQVVIGPALATARGVGGTTSFSLAGTFDLGTGAFSFSGSYVDGTGTTIPVNFSGTLPTRGGTGSIMLQIGPNTYSTSLSREVPPTPTPTVTPTPAGTVHTIVVGPLDGNSPFRPIFLEIQAGDTVVWQWTDGPHSVRSGTNAPDCMPDGVFESPVQSSGTFTRTFPSEGAFDYHCGVPGHCQNNEVAVLVIRGIPTATLSPTVTATRTPTVTPTPDTIGGVSVGMLGTFTGPAMSSTGTNIVESLQIAVDGQGVATVTDVTGFLFGAGAQRVVTPETPTKLVYAFSDPPTFREESLTLELIEPGHITGELIFRTTQPGMSFTVTWTLDLRK
jgi:plastocyanin